MDDKIVEFKKEKKVWICGCGCSTFELFSEGYAACANCECRAAHPLGTWCKLEDTPAVEQPNGSFMVIDGNKDLSFTKNRISQRAKDDDCALLVIGFASGEVTIWSEAQTAEQLDWAMSRLALATQLLSTKEV